MPIVSEAEPESVERKSIFNGITSEAQTFLVRLSSTPGMISSILLSSNCRSADSDASSSAEKFLFDQDSFLTLTKPVDPLKLSVVRLHSDLNMTKPKDHDGGTLAACKGSRSRCWCYPSDLSGLLIRAFDHRLLHPGPGQVLAKMRRRHSVVRVWEATRGIGTSIMQRVLLMGHHESRRHLMEWLWEFRCPEGGHLGVTAWESLEVKVNSTCAKRLQLMLPEQVGTCLSSGRKKFKSLRWQSSSLGDFDTWSSKGFIALIIKAIYYVI